jgi:hypothetical protein
VLWRVRPQLAASPREPRARRRRRGESVVGRHGQALRRPAAGDLQRPSALLFVGDNTPSATNGQGVAAFGGAWFAVSPTGNPVTKRSTAGRSNGY